MLEIGELLGDVTVCPSALFFSFKKKSFFFLHLKWYWNILAPSSYQKLKYKAQILTHSQYEGLALPPARLSLIVMVKVKSVTQPPSLWVKKLNMVGQWKGKTKHFLTFSFFYTNLLKQLENWIHNDRVTHKNTVPDRQHDITTWSNGSRVTFPNTTRSQNPSWWKI